MPEPRDDEGFFSRYLEPADRLNEVLFGLIMVLTITLTAGLTVEDGPDAARSLLTATLGCNVAWGIIDGAMYLTDALLARSRRARTITAVQRAPDEPTALAAIDRALEGTVVSLADADERRRLGRIIRDISLRLPSQRERFHKEDFYGAIASAVLVMLTTVPAAIPFLVIDEPWRALRVSNFLLVGMLFVVGHQWGRAAYVRPWLAGVAFLVVGLTMVGIAIALGG